MHPFFESVIRPLLAALAPRVLVEVGSEAGLSTRRLLAFCHEHGAVLHAVDPAPRLDLAAWQREHGERLVFHRGRSLEVLPRLPAYDAIFIDGDHNWYTVTGELQAVERMAATHHRPLPLTVLHDVGWPYGRRDLYYAPQDIPEEHRQAHARRGMRPGKPGLAPQGGVNAGLCNAVQEGGPRNGVLTAVEDYLAGSDRELELVMIPGFSGLGIVADGVLLAGNRALAKCVARLRLDDGLRAYVESLEAARLSTMAALADARAAASAGAELEGENARLRKRVHELAATLEMERDARERERRAASAAGPAPAAD